MFKAVIHYFASTLLFGWLVLASFYVCLQVYQSSVFLQQEPSLKLEKMREKTWDYLLHEKYSSLPNIKGYTIQERRHLLDVKRRLSQLEKSLLLSSILSVFLIGLNARRRGRLNAVIQLSSKIAFSVMMLITIVSLVSFKYVFSWLHQLLFNHGSWIFLEESYLIQLFPYHYFKEFFFLFLIVLAGFQIGLLTMAWGLNKRSSAKTAH